MPAVAGVWPDLSDFVAFFFGALTPLPLFILSGGESRDLLRRLSYLSDEFTRKNVR